MKTKWGLQSHIYKEITQQKPIQSEGGTHQERGQGQVEGHELHALGPDYQTLNNQKGKHTQKRWENIFFFFAGEKICSWLRCDFVSQQRKVGAIFYYYFSRARVGKAYHDGQWWSKHGDQRRHAHGANKLLPSRMAEEGETCMHNEREHADDEHQEPSDLELLKKKKIENRSHYPLQMSTGALSLILNWNGQEI